MWVRPREHRVVGDCLTNARKHASIRSRRSHGEAAIAQFRESSPYADSRPHHYRGIVGRVAASASRSRSSVLSRKAARTPAPSPYRVSLGGERAAGHSPLARVATTEQVNAAIARPRHRFGARVVDDPVAQPYAARETPSSTAIFTRACRQLSQIALAVRKTAAIKLRAVLS